MKQHRLLWISIQGVVFFIFFCLACPVWGQAAEKKTLTPADYHLWHHLFNPKISDNGKYASFLLSYENAEDTLVLQNTTNKKKIYVPNGTGEHFYGNKWFAYKQGSILKIYDLDNGTSQSIPDVIDYTVTPDTKYMVSLSAKVIDGQKSERKLRVVQLGVQTMETLEGVEEYVLNQKGDKLAYITREDKNWSLKVLEISNGSISHTLIKGNKKPLKRLVWGPDNNLAFLENSAVANSNRVFWLTQTNHKWEPKIFDLNTRADIEKGYVVVDNPSTVLRFSMDGERLFFNLQKRPYTIQKDNHGSKVQVWNAKDKLIYPAYNGDESFFRDPPFMGCWNGKSNTFFPLGNSESSKSILIAHSKYMFTHSLLDDMLSYDEKRDNTPINLYNVVNGEKRFVMWRKPYMPINVSPSGQYLIYFDETDWWVYKAEDNKYLNITKNIPSSFRDGEYDWSGVVPPYGLAGFTDGDHSVLLYDKYDMWQVAIDGSKAKRLTQGRENAKRYRLVKTQDNTSNFDAYIAQNLHLKEGLTFSTEDSNGGMGYANIENNSVLKQLVELDAKVDWIQKAKNDNVYLYTIERFDLPPQLMLTESDKKVSKELYKSNAQQGHYKWGKAELVKYSVPEGKKLKGALFYPSGFDPNKKYPMVVFIYERMSGKLHQYQNPTLLTGADINITNLTTRGYFVFCPDIAYTINNAGKSALESVKAGVAEALKTAPIDKDRIGLFGHSFGGYETSFIIGNTNIFAAAISASGYHDLKSFYFSIAWLWNLPQSGRFLNAQARYNKPYFNEPSLYEKNSPINYAPSINTPLLTITGDKDTNVNWEQSVEMYNALRLLDKDNIMLIYPDENHDFFKTENQIDMTYKRWQWFDHYLKDGEVQEWMVPEN